MLQIAASSKRIQLLSQQKVHHWIIKMAKNNQKKILSTVSQKSKIAVAMNCWSSQSRKVFLAIICYFFTEDFNYQEALLAFEPLTDAHERCYLTEIVMWVLSDHDFIQQVIAATTDDASNNDIMMDHWQATLNDDLSNTHSFQNVFDKDIHEITHSTSHVPCLAHVIQLAVCALLDAIKVTARNDDINAQWNANIDEVITSHHGLPSILEKMSDLFTRLESTFN